jgi:hypothetical protein
MRAISNRAYAMQGGWHGWGKFIAGLFAATCHARVIRPGKGMTKDLLLSIAVLAAFALMWGGWRNLRGQAGDKRRGWLMLGAAAVLLINLWVFSLPVPGR